MTVQSSGAGSTARSRNQVLRRVLTGIAIVIVTNELIALTLGW